MDPYNPEVDPVMKDEVVDKLLHEAAERILKED
jgi:hypothetical protein